MTNAERVKKWYYQHYETAKATIIARTQRYRAARPWTLSVQHANRRARKYGAMGTLTIAQVERIAALQGLYCANCGYRRKLTIDHIIPLCKQGANMEQNIQLLCNPCNASKGYGERN